MRLDQKVAIVTGGASGFGAGIARRFVAEGARVVIADINAAGAKEQAKALGAAALGVPTDLTDRPQVEALARKTLDWGGRIDILVNNAGIGHTPQPLDQLDEAMFDHIVAVNIKATYLTARAVIPTMKAAGGGVILNIASTGAVSPRPNLTWYNASKGWAAAATRGMAIELAPFRIRVNALNPVAGETPALSTFMGDDTPELRAKFLASIPLGRFSTPEDIGAAAAFLCSKDADLITGVALEVDGGRCI